MIYNIKDLTTATYFIESVILNAAMRFFVTDYCKFSVVLYISGLVCVTIDFMSYEITEPTFLVLIRLITGYFLSSIYWIFYDKEDNKLITSLRYLRVLQGSTFICLIESQTFLYVVLLISMEPIVEIYFPAGIFFIGTSCWSYLLAASSLSQESSLLSIIGIISGTIISFARIFTITKFDKIK